MKLPILAICSMAAFACSSRAENYWLDGSFESKALAHFSRQTWSGASDITFTDTEAHQGRASLKVNANAGAVTVWQPIRIGVAGEYTVSAFVKANTGFSGTGLTGIEVKVNGQQMRTVQLSPDHGWQKLETRVTLTIGDMLEPILAVGMYGSASGTVLFDSVSVFATAPPNFDSRHELILSGGGDRARLISQGASQAPWKVQLVDLDSETSTLVRHRRAGIDSVYIPWSRSRRERARALIQASAENDLAVVAEYNPGWWNSEWLKQNPEWNMHFSQSREALGGKPHVEWFPDFCNPELRTKLKAEFAEFLDDMRGFAGRSVVAICFGAYDYWHIPDGETHPEFYAGPYPHPAGESRELFLPFGVHVTRDFKQWLSGKGASLEALGFQRLDDVYLPENSFQSARTPEHWRSFVEFRRSIVPSLLLDLKAQLRAQYTIPIAITWDLNFALDENYASDTAATASLVDILFCYFYRRDDELPAKRWIRTMLSFIAFESASRNTALVAMHTFPSLGYSPSEFTSGASNLVTGFLNGYTDEVRAEEFWRATGEVSRRPEDAPITRLYGFFVGSQPVHHWQAAFDEYKSLATEATFPPVALARLLSPFTVGTVAATSSESALRSHPAFIEAIQNSGVPLVFGMNGDTDNDRFLNWEEAFIYQTNPLDPESHQSKLTAFTAIELDFYMLRGISYTLESSTNMTDWQPYGDTLLGMGERTSVLISTRASAAKYWRVRPHLPE